MLSSIQSSIGVGLGVFYVLVAGAELLYLLPSVIALSRRHHRAPLAVLVNLAFAWTVLGWFLALYLACSSGRPVAVTDPAYPVPARRW